MSDKTCKSCKWWGDGKPYRAITDPHNSKTCNCPKIVFAVTRDVSEEHDDDWQLVDAKSEQPIASDMAGVLDGSGYLGRLETGPDFGCIHHELKE
jgi:hypothetical protein